MDYNYEHNDQPNVFNLTIHSAAMLTAVDNLIDKGVENIYLNLGLNKPRLENEEELYNALIDSNFSQYMDVIAPVRDKFLALLSAVIERGELKPVRVIRTLGGSINPEETTLSFDELYKFYSIHDLQFSEHLFDSVFDMAINADSVISEQVQWWQLAIKAKIYGFDGPSHPERIAALRERLEEQLELENTVAESKKLIDLSLKLRYPSLNDAQINMKKEERQEHGNVKRFTKAREEVLGAAISVLASYPELCASSSGSIKATKIAKVLSEKALLFWPTTGEAPMELRQIENLLRDWLSKTK